MKRKCDIIKTWLEEQKWFQELVDVDEILNKSKFIKLFSRRTYITIAVGQGDAALFYLNIEESPQAGHLVEVNLTGEKICTLNICHPNFLNVLKDTLLNTMEKRLKEHFMPLMKCVKIIKNHK